MTKTYTFMSDEKWNILMEALERIKDARHRHGCSDAEVGYMSLCNCAEEIAEEALKKSRDENNGQ